MHHTALEEWVHVGLSCFFKNSDKWCGVDYNLLQSVVKKLDDKCC